MSQYMSKPIYNGKEPYKIFYLISLRNNVEN